mmetsp:Transcript_77576/g.207273  ORF Transcript_77576/g.207273 Transcript_77576/m.207273 type:complete len:438 (+) Transcript_77576:64-1377(+)
MPGFTYFFLLCVAPAAAVGFRSARNVLSNRKEAMVQSLNASEFMYGPVSPELKVKNGIVAAARCPGTPLPCSGKGYCEEATGTCWCAPGFAEKDCSGEAPLFLDIQGFRDPQLQDANGRYILQTMYLHIPSVNQGTWPKFISHDRLSEGWGVYGMNTDCAEDKCFFAYTGPGSLNPPLTGYAFGNPPLSVYTSGLVYDESGMPPGGPLDPNMSLPLDPTECCKALMNMADGVEESFKPTTTYRVKMSYREPINVRQIPTRKAGGYDMGALCGGGFGKAFAAKQQKAGAPTADYACQPRGLDTFNGYYMVQPRYVHAGNGKYSLMPVTFKAPGKKWVFSAVMGDAPQLKAISQATVATTDAYQPPMKGFSPDLGFTVTEGCVNHIADDVCNHMQSFCLVEGKDDGSWVRACCRSTCGTCSISRSLCTLPPAKNPVMMR